MKESKVAQLRAKIAELETRIQELTAFKCDYCREDVCHCDGDWSPYMQAYYHLPAQIAELKGELRELDG